MSAVTISVSGSQPYSCSSGSRYNVVRSGSGRFLSNEWCVRGLSASHHRSFWRAFSVARAGASGRLLQRRGGPEAECWGAPPRPNPARPQALGVRFRWSGRRSVKVFSLRLVCKGARRSDLPERRNRSPEAECRGAPPTPRTRARPGPRPAAGLDAAKGTESTVGSSSSSPNMSVSFASLTPTWSSTLRILMFF